MLPSRPIPTILLSAPISITQFEAPRQKPVTLLWMLSMCGETLIARAAQCSCWLYPKRIPQFNSYGYHRYVHFTLVRLHPGRISQRCLNQRRLIFLLHVYAITGWGSTICQHFSHCNWTVWTTLDLAYRYICAPCIVGTKVKCPVLGSTLFNDVLHDISDILISIAI